MKLTRLSRLQHTHSWCALCLLASLSGCGGDSNVGQVEGIVRLNGQPLTTGKVLFEPAAGRGASGEIQPDGTFVMRTSGADDGVAVGTHKVAIVAFEKGKAGRPDPTGPRAPMKALVPERYLATGTSEMTYEVKAGDNHAEFELTSP